MSNRPPGNFVATARILAIVFGMCIFWLACFLRNLRPLLSQNQILDAIYITLGITIFYTLVFVLMLMTSNYIHKRNPDHERISLLD